MQRPSHAILVSTLVGCLVALVLWNLSARQALKTAEASLDVLVGTTLSQLKTGNQALSARCAVLTKALAAESNLATAATAEYNEEAETHNPLRQQIEKMTREKIELSARIETQTLEERDLRSQIETLTRQQRELTSEVETLNRQAAEVQTEADAQQKAAEAEKAALQEKCSLLLKEVTAQAARADAAEQARDEADQTVQSLRRQSEALRPPAGGLPPELRPRGQLEDPAPAPPP